MGEPVRVVTLTVPELEEMLERAAERGVRRALEERAPAAESEWLSAEDVAQLLGYRRSYVPELVRRRALPCHRCGRKLRFRRAEVLTWQEDQARHRSG